MLLDSFHTFYVYILILKLLKVFRNKAFQDLQLIQ